jgi:hypothetical protein
LTRYGKANIFEVNGNKVKIIITLSRKSATNKLTILHISMVS